MRSEGGIVEGKGESSLAKDGGGGRMMRRDTATEAKALQPALLHLMTWHR